MPRTAAEILQEKEASGRYYFSGTPLTLDQFEVDPSQRTQRRYLLPAVPSNGSIEMRHFRPDAAEPVVCMTSIARLAIFRAISHQSLHTYLPKADRRTGWWPDIGTGELTPRATLPLQDGIRRLGLARITLYASVIAVKRSEVIARQHWRDSSEYRSTQPVPFTAEDVTLVDTTLWPKTVAPCPSWPAGFDLSAYTSYEPALNEALDDACNDKYPGDCFTGGMSRHLWKIMAEATLSRTD